MYFCHEDLILSLQTVQTDEMHVHCRSISWGSSLFTKESVCRPCIQNERDYTCSSMISFGAEAAPTQLPKSVVSQSVPNFRSISPE